MSKRDNLVDYAIFQFIVFDDVANVTKMNSILRRNRAIISISPQTVKNANSQRIGVFLSLLFLY